MDRLEELKSAVKNAYRQENIYELTWSLHSICNEFGVEEAINAIDDLPGREFFIAQERWVDEDTYVLTVVIDRKYEVDLW